MACVVRYNNLPHVELMTAAKEQMKITELRLQKLVASQLQQASHEEEAGATAERRAGLVLNHLMGAQMPQARTEICLLADESCKAVNTQFFLACAWKVGVQTKPVTSLKLQNAAKLVCTAVP